MHVKPGNEKRAEQFIDGLFGGESQGRCFHLTRARRKKYGGSWRTIQEELLPGYVFIATDEPEKLYGKLERRRDTGLWEAAGSLSAVWERRKRTFWKRLPGKGAVPGRSGFPISVPGKTAG